MQALLVSASSPSLSLYDLTCDGRNNPVGVDKPQPALSWKLKSATRGAGQSAYQVLVATKPELLTPDGADLWNSQQVKSSDTLRIPYAGKPLSTNQKAYWMVRSWDTSDVPSLWSEPAYFTTSLLSETDWTANWIGTEPDASPETLPIQAANWIWSDPQQDAPDAGSANNKPAGGAVRYFRKSFSVPASATAASIYITADNLSQVFLNDKRITETTDWSIVPKVDVTSALKPGADNIIEVRVENEGQTANSAGLALTLTANDATTQVLQVSTDQSWESSRSSTRAEWASPASPTRPQWQPVRVLGPWGVHPWHKISQGEHPVLPVYRKQFTADKPIKQALLHVTGLGHFTASINGQPVSDHFLDPAWTMYDKTVYFHTFDLTDKLTTSTNALGVMLGKGFYNTLGDRRIHGVHTDRPLALLAQLDLQYEDGSTTRITTDASWKWTPGPLTHNSILGGTDYDARILPAQWNQPGFDDSTWKESSVVSGPKGKLLSANAPSMRPIQDLQPVSVEQPEKGVYVYDFGQNCSATPRFTVNGAAGSVIKLVWAEQRKGQDPYTNNGKGPVIQSGIGHGYITYTLKGGGEDESFFCDLFYTGYQYLELTGAVPAGEPNPDNLPVLKAISSVHVRTDQPPVGTFATSNAMYNRIDKMIDWAVRSNFGHVFTDCPTREKLGWLEVPWLMWASTASRYNLQNYAEKITRDIADSQTTTGQVLTVAPAYPSFTGGFHYTPEWGAAGVFLPWYAYQWYDNPDILRQNYTVMKAFVDYMGKTSDDNIAEPGLGDWYDYLPGEPLGASRFTPPALTATAVFAGCTDVLSSTALLLDKPDDAKKYSRLAREIRDSYNKKFRTGPGAYQHTSSPQTAHAISLAFNMVPADEITTCALAIVKDLEARDWQQTSGDIGYRFLINALSQTGHSDAIFKILNRDKIGSYAYLVNSGWTSLPEAWNANPTSSMNHCMLGHIQEWFTQHLVGIAPAPGSLGFDNIVIQPTPGDGVTSAAGTLNSPRGDIAVNWSTEEKAFHLDVEIPANTQATMLLPVPESAQVTESGSPIPADSPIKRTGYHNGRLSFQVPSGRYSFVAAY